MSLTVLALDPHLGGVAWLREYVCHELGGDLMMADSVPAMEAAIDARTPDLLVIGPGTPPGIETDARAILRADRATAGTEVVRLGRGPAEPSRGRSVLGRWTGQTRQPDDPEQIRVAKRRISVTVDRIRAARERRLQEELAARLKRSVADAALPSGQAVRAPAGQPTPQPGSAPARPNSTRVAPLPPGKAPEPIGAENAWGFFDPARCGADALAAALDQAPVDPRDGLVEHSPADLLLAFDTASPREPGRASSAATPNPGAWYGQGPVIRPAELQPAASARWVSPGSSDSLDSVLEQGPGTVDPLAADVATDRMAAPEVSATTTNSDARASSRPFPLALWAHLADCCHAVQHPGTLRRWSEGFAGLATLALGLQLASPIGPAGSPTACRIHRIRVVDAAPTSEAAATPWSQVATVGDLDR